MNAAPAPDDAGLARQLAALAHPARLEIIRQLARDDGRCCKDVVQVLDLAQSTVSQHLKVLVDAGLVRFFAEGKRSRYCLDRAALTRLRIDIDAMLAPCGASGCASRTPPLQPESSV
ncbi:MAG: metalloregulator ArsR/SmtB family transcription factor [Rhizobiaceae bacterium]|jgi:DNA-binding transcriptional ArsR family regulator|nr:metalloregulator ArsR/SmtB family transcription factor [Rhizobiaceae bacterium]